MEEIASGALALRQPEKLTDWKNPPKLEDLKQNFQDAKPAHDAQCAKIQEWLDNLNIEGKAKLPVPKPGTKAKGSRVQPKLIRKQAEWRYPALTRPFLSTSDVFNVKPVTFEDVAAARQNQLVLNNQFNTKVGKVKFINDYVRTLVNEGTVIVRVGWCFKEEEYQEEVDDARFYADPSFAPTIQYLDHLKTESPSQYNTDVPDELKQAHQLSQEQGAPVRPQIVGKKVVTKKRTVKNHPTLKVCNFRNVIFDPTCGGEIEQSEFGIYSFESSLSQLRKEGVYKNLEQIEADQGGNSVFSAPDHAPQSTASLSFSFKDKPRKKLVVFEYWGFWDIDGTGVTKPIVVAWVGNTIIRMEEMPFPDKELPFITVPFLPDRDSLYGEPDGELLADNQRIQGAILRGMIDLMGKSANSQTGMAKTLLDPTNRRKYEAGQDYEFNPNSDPRQGIFMHTFPEIPQSAYQMLLMQNQDAESLTGVRSFSQGVSGESLGDVAVGVRGALDAASKRELDILERAAEGMKKIGRKIIAMNREWLSEEETVRVTNAEFVKVRRDDLAGNFDLELSISTAEEDHTKAQDLGFLLQTVGPNSPPDLSNMILAEICRLRKMPDLAHKLETYQPQPNPLAQKKLELEVQLLEAQLRREMAQAQNLSTGAELNQAKVGTEEAKAKQLGAQADLHNLDFVEQESGTKQARDLQLQGEQARSNMQLKSMEHNLKREEIHTKAKTDLLKEYVKAKHTAKEKKAA